MGKLLKRQPNEAMFAAYRANGAKSHGAISDRGKSVVRFNAAKHWARATHIHSPLAYRGVVTYSISVTERRACE